MSRKSCWLNLSCGVVCLVLLGHLRSIHAYDNYPAETYHPKPCAKLKNTITYNEPICLEDGTGGFLAYTVDNCVNKFRLTCPEFNEGECMRYGPENRPCCRLKYKAGYTWMEIYYSMQYKPTDYDGKVNPNDIVEIHRFIKKHADFGQRDQKDFPENVQDPKGERGLKWYYVTNLIHDGYFYPDDDINVDCMTKTTCEVNDLLNYVGKHYPNGFDPDHNKIELNTYEKDNNATVTTSISDDKCIRILLNRKVLGACQIIYYRESVTPLYTTKYPFHEVNFYRGAAKGNESKKPLIARYAYYNIESAEMRDQLFAVRNASETFV